MVERVLTQILAGSTPVYEVVEDPVDRGVVTIRKVESPGEKLTVIRSVLPVLARELAKISV